MITLLTMYLDSKYNKKFQDMYIFTITYDFVFIPYFIWLVFG